MVTVPDANCGTEIVGEAVDTIDGALAVGAGVGASLVVGWLPLAPAQLEARMPTRHTVSTEARSILR